MSYYVMFCGVLFWMAINVRLHREWAVHRYQFSQSVSVLVDDKHSFFDSKVNFVLLH